MNTNTLKISLFVALLAVSAMVLLNRQDAVAEATPEKPAAPAAQVSVPKPEDQPGANPAKNFPAQEFPTYQQGDKIIGDVNAPVTMFEYASLSCSHCAHFHKDILPELKKLYIDSGKLRIVFRHFPTNAPALQGAMLTRCAPEDKFESYLSVLFKQQEKWAFETDYTEKLATISAVGGMPRAEFDACMANKTLEEQIISEVTEASTKYKVASTPTFFVEGKIIEGARPVKDFSDVLDPIVSKP